MRLVVLALIFAMVCGGCFYGKTPAGQRTALKLDAAVAVIGIATMLIGRFVVKPDGEGDPTAPLFTIAGGAVLTVTGLGGVAIASTDLYGPAPASAPR